MAALKRKERERDRGERRMDDIFYLVASYDRLFGSGHCTASTVKTRKSPRGETRRPSCKLVSPWSPPKRRTTLTSKQIRFLLVRQKKNDEKKVPRSIARSTSAPSSFTFEILLKRMKRINQLKHERRTINRRTLTKKKRKRARRVFNKTRTMIWNGWKLGEENGNADRWHGFSSLERDSPATINYTFKFSR